MSETIQKGWITDENDQKFAPKTLIEQVQDNDGTPLQNYVDKMILTDEEDSTTIPEVSNDISNDIVQFTSEDNDGSELYTDFSLSSGSKISNIIQKITRVINNVKYMIKLLGNTDISSIGDGTLTGIVKTLNDSLSSKQNKVWGIKYVSTNGNVINWDLSNYTEVLIVGVKDNNVVSMHLDTSLIINNYTHYMFGSMVQQTGLVFYIEAKGDTLTPVWCFLNSYNSDLSGAVIYVYAR